jgi:mono/diheme cytochrome c family protein
VDASAQSKFTPPSLKRMHIAFACASILLLLASIGVFLQDHFGREYVRHQKNYDLARGSTAPSALRDAPGIDVIAPRHQIEQVILNALPENYVFGNTPRVDRCVTCHQAIANPEPLFRANAEIDPALRSHPRLDLFVAADSKHPYAKFGCTICHQGRPLGTSFVSSAHSPQNSAQAAAWHKQHDWQPPDSWDANMLPLQHTEASCLKCHRGINEIPEAAKLNEGRQIFQQRGCSSCHPGGDLLPSPTASRARPGPDLRQLNHKTNEQWLRRWIENPWAFRPGTKMPRLFGLDNRRDLTLDAHGMKLARDPVEAEAIATYLLIASFRLFPTGVLPLQVSSQSALRGDVSSGRKLLQIVGCVGCHSVSEAAPPGRVTLSAHGPDLSRIGEKVTPDWLRAWLRAPRQYWRETKMPDMRLSEQEATDIAAYLMTLNTADDRESESFQPFPEAAFDAIIADWQRTASAEIRTAGAEQILNDRLQRRAPDGHWGSAQIDSLLSKLRGDGRTLKAFLAGDILIQQHNCFACHEIQGWKNAPLPAPNLTGEANKDLDKFDFGHTLQTGAVSRTRWDWLRAKISNPRVFDQGRLDARSAFERLRMPWFGINDGHSQTGLTSTQIERVVTHLLSLTRETIPLEMQHALARPALAIDQGRRIFRDLNCTGCHLDGIDPPRPTPLLSLLGLLAPDASRSTSNLFFVDEDLVSLDRPAGEGTPLRGFINIARGTCLTSTTVPILLAEFHSQPIADATHRGDSRSTAEATGFRLERAQPAQGDWVPLGELLPLVSFNALTVPILFDSADQAAKAYERLKDRFVQLAAFEKLAGTVALQACGRLSPREVESRRQSGRFFESASVTLRQTRNEGAIVPWIIAQLTARGTRNAGQQHAPPCLVNEGGRTQPDWLYHFLHNVSPIRLGLSGRMPSFWNSTPDDPANDPAAQLVEFFRAEAREPSFGAQPQALQSSDRALYAEGLRLISADTAAGGLGCMGCHALGQRLPHEPRWAPNLANVKRRIKPDWLQRWLIMPQSFFPWAHMPDNFKFDWQGSYEPALNEWQRGLFGNDPERFEIAAKKLAAVRCYLEHSGDAEIGTETPQKK